MFTATELSDVDLRADENTGRFIRIKFIAVDIKKIIPVREATEILNDDLVEIKGQ